MQNINVFTHYTHKLAWQRFQRQNRKRPPLRLPAWFKAAVLGGLPCGLWAWSVHCPEVPAIICAGAAWGVILARVVAKVRERVRKVSGALQGRPLEADDLHFTG